ncbi:MAG: DUF4241 domain-containing protein [Myxococcaceae bacterium]
MKVPTGKLCVADPLMIFGAPRMPLLSRPVPPGVYPVEVAVLCWADDRRAACARVRFSAQPAVRWEMARFANERPEDLHQPVSYPVGSGMGSFFDMAAAGPLESADTEEWVLQITDDGPTFSHHVVDAGAANVVMFSSGYGDGSYNSYWGFDASGAVSELVTDFELLIAPVHEDVELALPLPDGEVQHPLLERLGVKVRVRDRTEAFVAPGEYEVFLLLEGEGEIRCIQPGPPARWQWTGTGAGSRLKVAVVKGGQPLESLTA